MEETRERGADRGQLVTLDVSRHDGVFCVIDRQGQPLPIRLTGQPVSAFLPGWQPRGANDSFPPWTVLDLVHDSGREASWLLTGGMEHWPLSLGQITAEEQALVAEQAAPAIRQVCHAMLSRPEAVRPPEMALFDGLNRDLVRQIVELGAPRAIGPTRVVDLYREAPDPAGYKAGSAGGEPVRLHAVQACLAGNFQEALQDALRDGALACASPVDGRVLRSADSMVLHEHRIAYRFVDERHGLVFFVSTTNHFFAKADLFVPCINTVFVAHNEDKPFERLAGEFLAHVIADAEPLLAYLADTQRRCAVICRGHPMLHMGHQLWNELTALDRLVRTVAAARLPRVIVPNAAAGSEVFAPIDRIFPELEGRVDRELRSPETTGAFVYRQRYCLFRALDEHVTQGLARRIRNASAEEPAPRDDQRFAARIEAERLPCVLVGLRVENRTAIDPAAMVAECIEHLRQRLGRLVVVIDGHNARLHHDPVSLYDSFGQQLAEPPIFAELQLVLQLHRRFDNTGVEILNLCGASMARSLYWSQRADFFVAVWGAGLAKYRWVCNRPGLVLSNLWNLRHRGDLDIYHAPRYQEAGASIRFIDAAYVTDAPEAPVLFAPGHPVPLYSNFRVDPGGLRHELDGMIREHLS